MNKIKNWMYYTFSATCFTISGVTNYFEGSNIRSLFLLLFSGLLYLLAFLNYRKKGETHKLLDLDDVEELEAELASLLVFGKKTAAIKKYRQITGVTLKEANDYIESMFVSKEELEKLDFELRDLLYDGKKNQAITKYREVTRANLQEANDYINKLM